MVPWKNTVISNEKNEKKQKFSWKNLLLLLQMDCTFMKYVFKVDFFEILSEKGVNFR